MLGVAIWGLWKINSRRQIGEEDQNSKYHWTGGEFTIFFLPVCPSLNLMYPETWKWALLIRTEKAPGEALWFWLKERKGSLSHILLFLLLFFLFFIFLHPRPQAVLGRSCSGLNGGRQEPKSQREGRLPPRLEELWYQESAANPIVFFSLCSSFA